MTKSEQVNFAQITYFADNITLNSLSLANETHQCWIVDTGVTNHICTGRNFFETLKPLANKILIHLPDGNVKNVQSYGNIPLHKTLNLQDVLFIHTFKHNLLSVTKLCKSNSLKFTFYPTFCILQDRKTEIIIAVGKMKGQLYILDTESFSPEAIKDVCTLMSSASVVNKCLVNIVSTSSIWHQRMGHPFEVVLQHLPFYSNKSEHFTN